MNLLELLHKEKVVRLLEKIDNELIDMYDTILKNLFHFCQSIPEDQRIKFT